MIPSQFYAGLRQAPDFFSTIMWVNMCYFFSEGDKYIVHSCKIEFCNTVFEFANLARNLVVKINKGGGTDHIEVKLQKKFPRRGFFSAIFFLLF